MNHLATSPKHTAVRGALVGGASRSGSGIAPSGRRVVADSYRLGMHAHVGAISPAPIGGVANFEFALAFSGH